jgi:hypothetical protein
MWSCLRRPYAENMMILESKLALLEKNLIEMNARQRCNITIVEQLENSTPSTLKIPMASTKKDAIVSTKKIRKWGD